MTSIASLEVELDLDSGRLTGQLTQAGNAVKRFGREAEAQQPTIQRFERNIDSVGQSVKRLEGVLKGFIGFQAIKAGAASLLDAQKSMQQIHYGFVGALGSHEAAAEAFDFVSAKSEELGLELQTTATEFTKLTASATALNVPMSEQKELFDGLARSATVLHLSADQMKYATMALSQMFGKGKIQAEELRRQLGEQIPGVVPRFQRAVMEMTKGTDLAGKSFDDLLRMGELSTDKYLPALVKALQETGKGAEFAAHSLNAELNRLSNAWFRMREEASKGLFTDVTIAGARFLANHLDEIATAATLAGAALVMNYGAKGIKSIGDLTAKRIADYKATQENLRLAAAEAAAEKNKQRELLRSAERTHRDTMTQIANNKARQAALQTEVALIQQRIRNTQAKIQQSGAQRRLRQQTAQLAAAQEALNRSMRESRILASTAVMQAEALTKARKAETAATAAANAANRSLSATRGLAGLATLLKNAGGSLLALAGGPWGLVIGGVMGLGYAYTSLKNTYEEAETRSRDFGDQLDLLSLSMQDANQQIANQSISVRAYAESWVQVGQSMRSAREDIVKQQEALEKAMLMRDIVTGARGLLFGKAGGLLTGEGLEASAKAKVEELSDSLTLMQSDVKRAEAEFAKMGQSLERYVDPASLEELRQAIQRAGKDDSLDAVLATLSDIARKANTAGFAIIDMVQGVDKRAANAFLDNIEKEFGVVARLEEELLQQIEARKALGEDVTEAHYAEVDAAVKKYAAELAYGEKLDEQLKARRKAEADAQRATEQRNDTVKSAYDRLKQNIAQSKEALALDDKMNSAQRLSVRILQELEAANIRLTVAEKERLDTLIATAQAEAKKVEEQERARKAAEELLRLQNEIAVERLRVDAENAASLASIGMGRETVQRMQREAAILADYQKRMADLRSSDLAEGSDSYEKQRKEIVAQYEWRMARESEFQSKRKAMEGDWKNGFTRAWEDIASEVNNTADQIADFTGTMFDGMTSALHSFVVNGKASFKDFTRSVLSDLAKIAMQKAIVGIAGSLFGGPSLQVGNPTAGGTWGFMPATFSANGNVLTPDGPMKLNYYEKGGIARSPQLSIFGEGRLPEAYVPLPDGRSIPVTMEGDVGGGGVLNNIEVNVHIDNKGAAQVNTSGGQGSDARNLGQALSASVKETIAQEMRPGGILWRWRN